MYPRGGFSLECCQKIKRQKPKIRSWNQNIRPWNKKWDHDTNNWDHETKNCPTTKTPIHTLYIQIILRSTNPTSYTDIQGHTWRGIYRTTLYHLGSSQSCRFLLECLSHVNTHSTTVTYYLQDGERGCVGRWGCWAEENIWSSPLPCPLPLPPLLLLPPVLFLYYTIL